MRSACRRTTAVAACLMAAGVASWNPAPAEEPRAPDKVVAELAEALAEAVAARHSELKADRRQLYALVEELLVPPFDLAISCRLILHQHWETATPEQRQRFVAAFYGFLLASYGQALLEFRHDTVKVLPGQSPPVGASTLVRTTMTLTGGASYSVEYYLRHDGEGWKIVDVLVEGTSYVRAYRTNFALEIRADGLEALIARLERVAAAAHHPAGGAG